MQNFFFKKACYLFAIKLSKKNIIIWPPKEANHVRIKGLAKKKISADLFRI